MKSRGFVNASERIGQDRASPLWAEHRSRYLYASRFTVGRKVLDVACGEGIGFDVLTPSARLVVGVDVSFEGLRSARSSVAGPAVLCQGDGRALPFADGTFEVITSFETIEHIPDDRSFIEEVRRVIRADGTLLLSTPNGAYSDPLGGPENPFHVREYREQDLYKLLSQYWSQVEILRQRTSDVYGVCPYWEPKEQIPRDLHTRFGVALWKLERRLPGRVAAWASRRLSHRDLYPGESDFVITSEGRDGHVLVAICRP